MNITVSSLLLRRGPQSRFTAFRPHTHKMSKQLVQTTTRQLTIDTISPRVRGVEYAVRGAIVIRAQQHERALNGSTLSSLPFKRVTYCNIGNPQQLGQTPITFFRQVLSLVEYPALMDNEATRTFFPQDAVARAKDFLAKAGGPGAYSESRGRAHVRNDVAEFIKRRDGAMDDPSYTTPDDIFLSDGASQAVQNCLKLLIREGFHDGILIPIPQYPLYSASIPLLGGFTVPYYLDENRHWSLTLENLKQALKSSKAVGIVPRALVVINPGNPTGACLEEEDMIKIAEFCYDNKIVLLADEVYQENVYHKSKPFVSFKKIVKKYLKKDVELLSFHSVSKGFLGECGHRGGYVEMTNIPEEVKTEYLKLISINLCSNIPGQFLISLMVNPPKPGDASYNLYIKERDDILNSLKKRADLLVSRLNSLPGITCNSADGALYAFPKITLPKKFVEEATAQNVAPDALYCMKLLDNTGLCVVPGSGFGQNDGEYHFRTTFLPQEDHLEDVLGKFTEFHKNFLSMYA